MRLLLLLALAIVTGTGSALAEMVWTKPGSNEQEFQQTRYLCMREAVAYPMVLDGMSIPNYELANACMNAHGFKRVQSP